MTKNGDKQTREERLAAKLRDNLRIRKAQARALAANAQANDESENDSAGLSKPPSES